MRPLTLLKYSFGKRETRGIRLRLALENLGPIYVKFGQILSTRRDLLPLNIADELVKLQDQVPPFPSHMARQMIKKSLGEEVNTLFADFEDKPIGSASIAQVHGARLKTGEDVVIKILRPGIEKQVKKDLRFIVLMSTIAELCSPTLRKLGLRGAVDEFKHILYKELDLNYEVANASQLKRNMEDLDWVVIPKVYWPYTRKNIAVFERIHAIRMSDKNALKAQGIDLSLLAERTIALFFTAVFEHNFFHADMHAGNIFIEKTPNGIHYILVDFGIMGTLPTEDQRYLAENFSAFFAQDYDRVAQLHIASGWVPPGTRQDEFANAIRTVCEPIFSRKPSEISFAELFLRLLQTARQFNMVILPQLMLLQKTLMNVEGLARYLDPNIDIWDTAKPCLEQFFKQQSTFKLLRKQLRNVPAFITGLFALPEMLKEQKTQAKRIRKAAYQSFALGFACAALLGIGYFWGM